MLLERALVELVPTEGAREVLRVPLALHGGDAAPGHRLLAAGAQRAAARVVVLLAVRPPVVLVERAAVEAARALLLSTRA